jgi:hypothetical protein
MSEQSPDIERFRRRQANIFVWVVLTAFIAVFIAVFGGLGFAIAQATHGKPEWASRIHIAIGLFFLTHGLIRQFRLAAYGPKSASINRVQDSVMNSGMILLGIAQLANDSVVETPLVVLALILMLAASFKRPRRFF